MGIDNYLVQLSDVSKVYPGGRVALRNINLSLSSGECLALLGANGSGKSTLLRLLAQLSRPTNGYIFFSLNATRVGYVPERIPLRIRFSPLEYLTHMGAISGIAPHTASSEAVRLLAKFGLSDAMNVRMDTLSKGMRQKVGLIQALIPLPGILLLDEPTSGLDAEARSETLEMLRYLSYDGVTIVFSTHDYQLARQLASRTIRLDSGVMSDVEPSIGYANLSLRVPPTLDMGELTLPECAISLSEQNQEVLKISLPVESVDAFLLQTLKMGCSVLSVDTPKGKR